MLDYSLKFFIDFIIPGLIGLVGLFFIRRGIKAHRIKPARRCLKCGYDMRESRGLACPECGHVAKNQKEIKYGRIRPVPVAVGVLLLLPTLMIAGFFAWYIPQTYFLRKHVKALKEALQKPHWPRVVISRHEQWDSAGRFWIAPWSGMFITRSELRIYELNNRPTGASRASTYHRTYDLAFARTYLLNMLCTPGRHYGRYIRLRDPVPVGLTIRTNGSRPDDAIDLTGPELTSLLSATKHLIQNVWIEIDRESRFKLDSLDGMTGLYSGSLITDDLTLVEWMCRLPELEYLSVTYNGPPQDADKIATAILSGSRALVSLQIKLNKPAPISPDLSMGLLSLPIEDVFYIPDFQLDVTQLPNQLLPNASKLSKPDKIIALNLIGSTDAQLQSLRHFNPSFLFLDLNYADVSDKGMNWLSGSMLAQMDLKNASGITFESIGKLPYTFLAFALNNVGLTDKGLQELDAVNLTSLSVSQCPVSDAALIQLLRRTSRLRALSLGNRKPSRELIAQLETYATARGLVVWITDIDDQTLDAFLATRQGRLTLMIRVDWDRKKTDAMTQNLSFG